MKIGDDVLIDKIYMGKIVSIRYDNNGVLLYSVDLGDRIWVAREWELNKL